MRISGGSAKGRKTGAGLLSKSSKGERLRPTSAKVREALFDILSKRIEGSSFVDLYAGSGTVGMEALSRGAAHVVLVEERPDRFRSVREISGKLGFWENAEVVKGTAEAFVRKASARKLSFDIFFLDPPYQSDEIEKVLPLIGEGTVLKERGLVVIEHFTKKKVPEGSGQLVIQRQYRYGDTLLTLYRRAAE
jgi:16S rRNA (guanine966-N2)-methyltransferase